MEYQIKCFPGYHPRINVTDEFIQKNNLRFARTEDVIIERIKNLKEDIFNFEREVLGDYLPFKSLKALRMLEDEYIKKVESGAELHKFPITDINEAVQDMLDYMVFGWMKAMDERGISASRTISKIGAWLWLLGRDDLYTIIHDDSLYNPYGSPALIKVCENLGISVPADFIEFSKRKCYEI